MVARRAPGDGRLARVDEVDVVAPCPEVYAERPKEWKLVVDDEHAAQEIGPPASTATTDRGSGASSGGSSSEGTGRLITIVRPPPSVSSTEISPPIASTKPRAPARPSPTPVSELTSPSRWNGWNTRSRWATGIPGPRSTTRRYTLPATIPASTLTGRPAGE